MARNNVKVCACGHRKGVHRLIERANKGPCTHDEQITGKRCPCTRYDGP